MIKGLNQYSLVIYGIERLWKIMGGVIEQTLQGVWRLVSPTLTKWPDAGTTAGTQLIML